MSTPIFNRKSIVHKNLLGRTTQEEDTRLEYDLISWREALIAIVKECDLGIIEANRVALARGNGMYAKADLAEKRAELITLKSKATTKLSHIKEAIKDKNRSENYSYQQLQLEELRIIRSLIERLVSERAP